VKTKIIATLGPASSSFAVIKKLAAAGMNIARINTKYADADECRKQSANVRKAGCKVLVDIKGTGMINALKEIDFDYLAVSFAQSGRQIKEIRNHFSNKKILIISKIEDRHGFNNLAGLIKESNGIMVARGDLGRNVPLEQVPIFQKLIIKDCKKKNKFVVTATEMLLSMTKSKIPERAEVSDVANAVLDGSSALMLSEETAIGNYPVLAVQTMRKVISATERNAYKLRKSKK
jgi:pyruvate kinase